MKVINKFLTADESDNFYNDISFDSTITQPISFTQVHGKEIKTFDHSHIIFDHLEKEEYDGGLLTTPGIMIIRTADCLPVILYDEGGRWTAILHCGWRSIKKNIIFELIQILKKKKLFDENNPQMIKNLKVKIGPGICENCYEVRSDFLTNFEPMLQKNKLTLKQYSAPKKSKKDTYFFNLKKLVVDILLNNRILVENISDIQECTLCNPLYHSYRRNKTEQRNINYVQLI